MSLLMVSCLGARLLGKQHQAEDNRSRAEENKDSEQEITRSLQDGGLESYGSKRCEVI